MQDQYWKHSVFSEPHITVNGKKLKVVNRFIYLGSMLSQNANIDDEVNSRTSKASSTFGRLYKNVWHRAGIRLETKLKVYRAAVLPVLLYACETWTVYRRHTKKLDHFHTLCLRKLLNIKWQDKVPDTAVLERAGMTSIDTMLKISQIRWAGHVVRMPDHRIPKILLYGELQNGKRSQGGPKKRFKDSFKKSLKDFQIDPGSWETKAQDRTAWRSSLRSGARTYEAACRRAAEQLREVRKARALGPQPEANILCPHCPRLFRAQIGLTSHLRGHSS